MLMMGGIKLLSYVIFSPIIKFNFPQKISYIVVIWHDCCDCSVTVTVLQLYSNVIINEI